VSWPYVAAWRKVGPTLLKECPRRRAALAVGEALAHRHNGRNGRCDPSIRRLALDTGLHPRTVQTAVYNLEAIGVVAVERRHRRRNRYRFVLAALTLYGATPSNASKARTLPGRPLDGATPSNWTVSRRPKSGREPGKEPGPRPLTPPAAGGAWDAEPCELAAEGSVSQETRAWLARELGPERLAAFLGPDASAEAAATPQAHLVALQTLDTTTAPLAELRPDAAASNSPPTGTKMQCTPVARSRARARHRPAARRR
jgi:hypothetical protein